MEPASESTPSFSAPDSESLGKVKDAALDKAQDLFALGKAKLDKVRHLDITMRSPASLFERPLTTETSRPTADAPPAPHSQVVRFGGNPTMNIELRKVRPNSPCFPSARARGPIAADVEHLRATRFC